MENLSLIGLILMVVFWLSLLGSICFIEKDTVYKILTAICLITACLMMFVAGMKFAVILWIE